MDTAAISIVENPSRTVAASSWSEGIDSVWRAIGDPEPYTESSPTGPTLVTNGDGSFSSGVYLRQSLDAGEGIGVELRASLPINAMQWQDLTFGMAREASAAALAAWDHRTGASPVRWGPTCGVGFGGEGGSALAHVGLAADEREVARLRTPAGLYSGRWVTVRLQLFPDGRCGLALDGKPVLMSSQPMRVVERQRVHIHGHTVRTRIRVGRTEVWTGVRGGVDWEGFRAERASQTRPAP